MIHGAMKKPSYYPNGKIKERWSSSKDNKIETYEYFNESGILVDKGSYKNGLQDGPYEIYFDNGQLWDHGVCKKGKLHGRIEIFHENGRLALEGNYKDGKLDGCLKTYFENGKLESVEYGINGYKSGFSESFYVNGNTKSKGEFNKDKGIYIENFYYEDGIIEKEIRFKNNKLKYQKYDINGLPFSEDSIENNEPFGFCSEFLEDPFKYKVAIHTQNGIDYE